MKHQFLIAGGDDQLILSTEGEKEDTLCKMVFPKEGEYNVSIQGNTITIKKKKDPIGIGGSFQKP